MHKFKLTLVAASLLCAAIAGNSPAAYAAPTDGKWSVLIVTERGSCGRAYLDNVNVSHGHVAYRGYAPIKMAGTVAPNGLVKVSIKAGQQGANGTGRLLASAGRGTWTGHGSGGECAGHWLAQRH